MKAIHCLVAAASIAALSPGEEPAALEVHEWGTFTVVSGSDGTPLRWWQPAAALQVPELPAFVGRNFQAYKSAPWFVRMETPVLYFYPEAPLTIEVTAEMSQGRITEWFPHPVENLLSPGTLAFAETAPHRVTWKGRLIPASDPRAAARLPKAEGPEGHAYAQARQVPDAWFIQSPDAGQTEKFIFYRGAGNVLPPWQARADAKGAVELATTGAEAAALSAFAVQTTAGTTRWARMSQSGKGFAAVTVGESTAAPSDLAPAMIKDLTAAGLTGAEAEAMVATWNGHWFSEPGTRVLAILPQAWVDAILPLTVTPAPRKSVRVFVARFEVLTPEKEDAFLALLDGPVPEPKRLAELQLGRFASAALVRAQNQTNQRLQKRFAELSAGEAQ